MAIGKRCAFTLIELLVVVTIIGALMALVVRGVLSARTRAQTVQCLNNEKELFTAMTLYKEKKGHYPGYRNRHVNKPISWAVALFDYMGRADLWELWSNPTLDYNTLVTNSQYYKRVEQLVCPADEPPEADPLSYVVNCGMPGENTIHTDLFFDRYGPATPISVTETALKDGGNNTLVISENLQAGAYAHQAHTNATDPTLAEVDLGMIWVSSPNECQKFNRCPDPPVGNPSQPLDTNYLYVRPSSNHAGGCNVFYAAGNGEFVSDTIDYKVYQQKMAPDDNWCIQQGLMQP